jgi:hypothetical protein
LARYGAADKENEAVIVEADSVVDASMCTLLECFLARSLKKTSASEQFEGCKKYLSNYAMVPELSVHAVLWAAAQTALNNTT